jgi:hypothetical protein
MDFGGTNFRARKLITDDQLSIGTREARVPMRQSTSTPSETQRRQKHCGPWERTYLVRNIPELGDSFGLLKLD